MLLLVYRLLEKALAFNEDGRFHYSSSVSLSVNINRIKHQSPIQTEKSQPSSQRIMPKTR